MKSNLPQSQPKNYNNGQTITSEPESIRFGFSENQHVAPQTSDGQSKRLALQLSLVTALTKCVPSLQQNHCNCNVTQIEPSPYTIKIIYYIDSKNYEYTFNDWYIRDRFRDLAIFRALQIERHININLIKSAVAGTDKLIQSFAGVIGAIHKTGFVAGEPAGYDKNGRPYKDWKIADAGQARGLLKKRRIRPLPPEAIENIKRRREKA